MKVTRTKFPGDHHAQPLTAVMLVVAVGAILAAALALAHLGGRAIVFYHPRPFAQPGSHSVVIGVDWYDGCNVRLSALRLHWRTSVGVDRYETATHIYCF